LEKGEVLGKVAWIPNELGYSIMIGVIAMAGGWNKEVCDGRHDHIEKKENRTDDQIDKLHGRITAVWVTLFLLAVGGLGTLAMYILKGLKKS